VNNIKDLFWLTFNFGRTVLKGAFCHLANVIFSAGSNPEQIRNHPNMPARSGAPAICVPARAWTAEPALAEALFADTARTCGHFGPASSPAVGANKETVELGLAAGMQSFRT
jgi:hypothetical protein